MVARKPIYPNFIEKGLPRVTTKGEALRLCRSARCLFYVSQPSSVPLSHYTRPFIVAAHKERSSTRMNKHTQIVNAQISDQTERKENATHPPRGRRSIIGKPRGNAMRRTRI